MPSLLRFKPVEIHSNISFRGRKKQTLKYPVRSVALVSDCSTPQVRKPRHTLPEIFWQ